MAVTITNADRVLFPDAGWTKGDVAAHYARVAARVLPYLAGRPLTLVRHPRGIGAKGFFQKNAPGHYPMRRIAMPRKRGSTVHPCVESADELQFVANQGAIELHVPLAREPELDAPDWMAIDLDPPEGAVELARQAARDVRAALEAAGQRSVPVATGSKGYHVYVALQPTADYRQVCMAVSHLVDVLLARHPSTMTVAFPKAERGERVYLDWGRNGYGATVVAPWSLRARPGAPVAVPIGWDELDAVPPDGFRLGMPELAERGDPLWEARAEAADGVAVVEAVLGI